MALGDLSWMMAIAVMFGLAFVMTWVTFRDVETFFIWLTIFGGFAVWSGLIDLWILIILIIVLVLIIGNKVRGGRD